MNIAAFSRTEWIERYQKAAHQAVFGGVPADLSKSLFDKAFVVCDDEGEAVIFNTIKQTNAEMLHIEHGGSFPEYKGSVMVKTAFRFLLEGYKKMGAKSISLATRNTNVSMQKLALAVGFIPVGMTFNGDGLFLEYTLDFKEGE